MHVQTLDLCLDFTEECMTLFCNDLIKLWIYFNTLSRCWVYVCVCFFFFFLKKEKSKNLEFNFNASLLAWQGSACRVLTTCWRAIFTHASVCMRLQIPQKEAYVTEALSKYVMTLRKEYRYKKKTNFPVSWHFCFFCMFFMLSTALQSYCFCARLPLAGCGVWKVRMPDACCLTWCLVTSWGLVGCHVPLSAHALNSSLPSL